MAGTRKAGGADSKKAQGQARKAETAAKKAAAVEAQKEAEEADKWQKGTKSSAKKESEAAKKAEAAKKKAEREALLAEEEKNTPGRSQPKNAKTAVKKSRGLDLSQLDDQPTALNASGIDNALDALTLTGPSDIKIDRHPERRAAAAFPAWKEAELKKMAADGTSDGLRRSQRDAEVLKRWKNSPDNPMNQVSAHYNATKEELAAIKAAEKSKIESHLGA